MCTISPWLYNIFVRSWSTHFHFVNTFFIVHAHPYNTTVCRSWTVGHIYIVLRFKSLAVENISWIRRMFALVLQRSSCVRKIIDLIYVGKIGTIKQPVWVCTCPCRSVISLGYTHVHLNINYIKMKYGWKMASNTS